MAQFHMNVSVVGRTSGASAVAGAAYISRSRILDERTGLVRDFRRCHRHEELVADLGVTLPSDAPGRWRDRAVLWNEVEAVESSARAQLCRRVEVALPVELGRDDQLALAREIAGYFAGQGMVVDACVHDAHDGHNPHLHLLMPLRACDRNGFLPKSVNEYLVRDGAGAERWASAEELRTLGADGAQWEKVYRWQHGSERLELTAAEAAAMGGCTRSSRAPVQRTRYLTDWNARGKAEEWRAAVAAMENEALGRAGRAERVDHRSYARRGIDRIPTEHEGPAAFAAERRAERRQARLGLPRRFVTARRVRNERARRRNGLLALLLRELLFQLERRARRDLRRATGVPLPHHRRQPQRSHARGRGMQR